jgi:hypothetical protein
MNALKDKFTRFAAKMAKPMAKRFAKNLIKDNQTLIIDSLKKKVDIPKLTTAEETKLWNQVYDGLEEAVTLIIDRI